MTAEDRSTPEEGTVRKSFADLKHDGTSVSRSPESSGFADPVPATDAVGVAGAERVSPKKKTPILALVLLATGVVAAAALIVLALSGAFSGGPGAGPGRQIGGLTPAQSAAAEQQDAQSTPEPSEGGRSKGSSTDATEGVQGHAVSPAFCKALDTASTVEIVSATEFSQEAQDAWAAVAKLDSPNQKAYEGFAEFVKDPIGSDSNEILPAWSKAMQEDAAACA